MTEAPSPATAPRPKASRVAAMLYVLAVVVYAAFAGDRLRRHSPDNHYAYMADALLHGTLAVRCDDDRRRNVDCPPGGGGNDWARFENKWFVAFPSFPGVVYMPAVAVFGRDFPNRILDVLIAALSPSLLYLLLEDLVRRGHSRRAWRENVGFSLLFAFGTVFFFSAVQGSVWFTAHLVAAALAVGFLGYAIDLRNPWLAGLLVGLSFHTRPPTLLAAIVVAMEAARLHRRPDATLPPDDADVFTRVWHWARGIDVKAALRPLLKFAVPLVVLGVTYMAINKLRFHDWNNPGYQYLQIRWQGRIVRWGLFNYHYLSRNLAVALALLPWATRAAPFVQISRHGLALWVTTPQYLELARLRNTPPVALSLGVAAAAIAVIDLLYQNSGWVQFGYRFSNDYAVLLVVLLAVAGRPLRRGWWAVLALAIAINGFGAATFDRSNNLYLGDNDGNGMFQPD